MTSEEALKALGEMISTVNSESPERTHYFEVVDRILDKEVPSEELTDKD